MARKKRSDRNHLVYRIDCVDGRFYIGVTVLYKQRYKDTLRARLHRHVHRAMTETKEWALSKAIRDLGADSFAITLLEVVRGKAAAHRVEVSYIDSLKPSLNTATKKGSQPCVPSKSRRSSPRSKPATAGSGRTTSKGRIRGT